MGPTSVAPDEIQELKKKKIFCIVAYCTPQKTHRCFGYYTTYSAAKTALEGQWKNIEECLYDSFFIEEVDEGLHATNCIKEFYTIVEPERKLIKAEIPEELKRVINWSIG